LVRYPVRVAISRLGTGSVCIISFLISIIVTLPGIIVAITILDTDIELAIFLVSTINITDITTTENIAITFGNTLGSTYFTAIDVHLSLSEDETIGIERTAITHIIIAAASTEHITVNMAVV